jgi:flagellar hook protein FlgE
MLQAMFNGVSAIEAQQQQMDVIGNNIANVNTTAFKAGRVTFQDQLSQTIQGASLGNGTTVGGTNAQQIGLGVRVGSIDTSMEQGGLAATARPTDLAIQGNGFFMLGEGSNGQVQYTRDGSFTVDNNGNLVNASSGQYVLGWQSDTATGVPDTTKQIDGTSHLSIPVGSLTSVFPTSAAVFGGNLSADALSTDAAYTRSVNVYDSLGKAQTVTMGFTRDATLPSGAPTGAASSWTWTATGSAISGTSGTAPDTKNTGTIYFDTSGKEIQNADGTSASTGQIELTNTDASTTPQDITPDFSSVTQVSGTSTTAPVSQNGFGPGTLSSFSIDETGSITGIFNNGQTRVLGQIAMANFANPEGLQSAGGNNFDASINSGLPQVGTAEASGLGKISTGYLEQSNVDLSTEFTNMIVSQRGFQANTKIVSTVDQMLNDVITMKQ